MGTTADKLQHLIDGKQLIVDSTNTKANTNHTITSKWTDIADSIYGITTGANTSDATAVSSDVLLGKTAYGANGLFTGTIETYDGDYIGVAEDPGIGVFPSGTLSITENGGYDVTYYKNVVVDVQTGSNTSDATAVASDILLGKTAYGTDGKLTGTIPTYGGSFTGSAITVTSTNELKSLIREGVGYIDTGVDGANSNLKFEIRYEFTSTMSTTYFSLIAAYVSESTNATRLIYYKDTNLYVCLNSVASSSLGITSKRYINVVYTDIIQPESSTTFSCNANGVKSTKARTSGTALTNKTIQLFPTSSDGINLKIYYLKIYDNGVLIRDYVPYLSQDNECGLYDKVNGVFYGNNGSGTFKGESFY